MPTIWTTGAADAVTSSSPGAAAAMMRRVTKAQQAPMPPPISMTNRASNGSGPPGKVNAMPATATVVTTGPMRISRSVQAADRLATMKATAVQASASSSTK